MICPNCQERLKPDAIVCTHCGHPLEPIPAVAKSGARPTPNRWKFGCGLVAIALVALVLWVFADRYQAESESPGSLDGTVRAEP